MAATLPRQGTAELKPWSLTRHNQSWDALEAGWAAGGGAGLAAGGRIRKTAALAVELEVSTIAVGRGVAFTTDAVTPQAYSGFGNGTVYLWGLVTRTAANQNNKTDLDLYTFPLSHVTNDPTPPSADHIPLAVLDVAAGDIRGVDDLPPGKYLPNLSLAGPRGVSESVPVGTLRFLDSGHQADVRGGLLVRGRLLVRGHLRVRGWDG